MSGHYQLLVERRGALIERSRQLRLELAADAVPLAQRLRFVDRVFGVGRWEFARMLVSAAAVLLVFGRVRRLLRIAVRVLAWYPVVRPLVARLWQRRAAAP